MSKHIHKIVLAFFMLPIFLVNAQETTSEIFLPATRH